MSLSTFAVKPPNHCCRLTQMCSGVALEFAPAPRPRRERSHSDKARLLSLRTSWPTHLRLLNEGEYCLPLSRLAAKCGASCLLKCAESMVQRFRADGMIEPNQEWSTLVMTCFRDHQHENRNQDTLPQNSWDVWCLPGRQRNRGETGAGFGCAARIFS